MKKTTILDLVARKLAPFMLLFGFYLLTYGHLSPGGGFQGGVVIASGVILLAISRGVEAAEALFPVLSLTKAEAFAFFSPADCGTRRGGRRYRLSRESRCPGGCPGRSPGWNDPAFQCADWHQGRRRSQPDLHAPVQGGVMVWFLIGAIFLVGLWGIMNKANMIKKVMALSIANSAVILLFIYYGSFSVIRRPSRELRPGWWTPCRRL